MQNLRPGERTERISFCRCAALGSKQVIVFARGIGHLLLVYIVGQAPKKCVFKPCCPKVGQSSMCPLGRKSFSPTVMPQTLGTLRPKGQEHTAQRGLKSVTTDVLNDSTWKDRTVQWHGIPTTEFGLAILRYSGIIATCWSSSWGA